jgi:hypothetical protein
MKIPVWLATILVGAMISTGGVAVEHLSSKMDDMEKEIVTLKVDMAIVKARVAPDVAQMATNSGHHDFGVLVP